MKQIDLTTQTEYKMAMTIPFEMTDRWIYQSAELVNQLIWVDELYQFNQPISSGFSLQF